MEHSQHWADAANAVERADRLARTVAERSAWYPRFLLVFGVAVLIVTPLWGLLTSGTGSVVLNLAWVAFIVGITWYVRRQGVAARGTARRYLWVIAVWAVIYAVVLTVGLALLRTIPHGGFPPAWRPLRLSSWGLTENSVAERGGAEQ